MFQKKKDDASAWTKAKASRFLLLSSKEKMFFAKYLGVMLQAGIPLDRSLVAIHNQSRSSSLHAVLHIVLTDVASGEFLSSSLKKFPRLFDNLFINMVTVGEESGTLAESMFRLADHIGKTRELQAKIRGATLYPLIVVSGTLATAAYLVLVLLPQLAPLFISLNIDLPWTTRVVLNGSVFLTNEWPWVIAGIVALIGAWITLRHIQPTRYAIDWVALRIPVLGPLIKKIEIAQMSSVAGTLLKAGVTIIDALKIAAASAGNAVYRHWYFAVADSIQEGEDISHYLAKHRGLFPGFVTQMIAIGEETGKLDDSFLFISDFAQTEIDDATKTLTTVLEPLLLLVVGGFVGFIAIAIITPIYSLTTGIHT
ncbi:hypothetical protein A2348_04885 [Candidatus Uhrbacteria bacterium RIFOXYB12_FULL_58_10]|uniref:Type II secretion system protein GspF domain-containing protein n=1 Tax=Candidatus Uhrbacteria bacterium RIFOXYB2_FULL_57_15 TaxID=1802422 RepID=A0A1F7W845_9BACT|nr:MAG: hypothetical protein A2348_04885 [Candidatus Uhrbacteria bacterium RIFOXYB12_FULL_58_10]OGL98806.1 MAG: hypothetical protein A2304_04910 [Candidatus Uhrbacteria bacterium RIFOXYB2_FULL_57_15]OGL99783.1 MAG: hypothetical protein A2501_04645 [Candidatus Uhrbacteria bacterium RIFOXYC12_FULL_57_11]